MGIFRANRETERPVSEELALRAGCDVQLRDRALIASGSARAIPLVAVGQPSNGIRNNKSSTGNLSTFVLWHRLPTIGGGASRGNCTLEAAGLFLLKLLLAVVVVVVVVLVAAAVVVMVG